MLTEANEQKQALESEYSTLSETTKALEDRIAEMDASDEKRAEELAVSCHPQGSQTTHFPYCQEFRDFDN